MENSRVSCAHVVRNAHILCKCYNNIAKVMGMSEVSFVDYDSNAVCTCVRVCVCATQIRFHWIDYLGCFQYKSFEMRSLLVELTPEIGNYGLCLLFRSAYADTLPHRTAIMNRRYSIPDACMSCLRTHNWMRLWMLFMLFFLLSKASSFTWFPLLFS